MKYIINLPTSLSFSTFDDIIMIICIVQVIILGVIWCDRHNIKKKYLNLIRDFQKQRILLQSPSLYETVNTTVNEVPQSTEDSEEKNTLNAVIYSSLQKLMEEDKIYHDPRLTRDMVVNRLGTSRKTFLEALRYYVNMTFTEYTNKFRLNEAVELLEKGEYTNETIAEEVGFGSVNTFYRQFRLKYGIPPSEYRKTLNDNLVSNRA